MSDYGSEEFENYDDDNEFEAEEEEEGEQYDVLPQAMTRNSVAGAPPPPQQQERPNSAARKSPFPMQPPRQGSSAGIIEIVLPAPPMAKLTEAQIKKRRQRLAAGLKKFPKLKLSTMMDDEIFTLSPLTEYDLFMMGRSTYATKKVGAMQTNDDDKEEECQTDDIDGRDYTCQAPDDRNLMTDDEVNAMTMVGTGAYQAAAADAPSSFSAPPPAKSAAVERITNMEPGLELKLNSFITWAGPIVLAALGISPSTGSVTLQPDPHGGSGLGAGMVPLAYSPLLANRPVTSVAVAPTAGDALVLAAYGPLGAELGAEELLKDHTLASKGCLCVWDLSQPSFPRAILVSEGTPSCCGFAPAPASHIVFAGMEDGGVCVWDLEEPAGKHTEEEVNGVLLTTRRPSFTTEYLLSMDSGPIVSVVAVPRAGHRKNPCYLYSLTAWGDVSIWTLNLLTPQEAKVMDQELGMRVGSSVRLIRVAGNVRLGLSSLWPVPNSTNDPTGRAAKEALGMNTTVRSSSLQALPSTRTFLVAGDSGRVLKGSWAGVAVPPKEYVAHDHTAQVLLEGTGRLPIPSLVTSLHLSPFCPWVFAAGHDDGTLTVHSTALATASVVMPGAATGGVKVVRWSPSKPCMLFVLDSMCTVLTFDLSQSTSGPVHSQSFMTTDQSGVPSLATSLEVGSLTQGDGSKMPGFCVGYDDGRVDFIAFNPRYGGAGSASNVDAEVAALVEMVGPEPAIKASKTPLGAGGASAVALGA